MTKKIKIYLQISFLESLEYGTDERIIMKKFYF